MGKKQAVRRTNGRFKIGRAIPFSIGQLNSGLTWTNISKPLLEWFQYVLIAAWLRYIQPSLMTLHVNRSGKLQLHHSLSSSNLAFAGLSSLEHAPYIDAVTSKSLLIAR